jgi:hypothetical protein
MSYFDTSILASNTFEEFKSAVNRKHWNLFQSCPIPDEYKSKISYIPNSFGFRDTEIISDVDICYYGCSITYGIGVPLESRYTNLIDNKLNYTSNNFAVGGSSLEDAAHLFITTSKFVKMKTAFFLLPEYLRTTFPVQVDTDYRYFYIFPNYEECISKDDPHYNLAKIYYQQPESVYIERARNNLEMICNWAKIKNIKLIFGSWAHDVYNNVLNTIKFPDVKIISNRMKLDSKGCDNSHPGENSHRVFSQNIIAEIKKYNEQ